MSPTAAHRTALALRAIHLTAEPYEARAGSWAVRGDVTVDRSGVARRGRRLLGCFGTGCGGEEDWGCDVVGLVRAVGERA